MLRRSSGCLGAKRGGGPSGIVMGNGDDRVQLVLAGLGHLDGR